MRSGQIAFIQDKTFQSDILMGKDGQERIPPMIADHSLRRRSLTLQLLSSCWNGRSGKAKQRPTCLSGLCWSRSRSSLSAAVEAISIFSIMTWEGIPPNGVTLSGRSTTRTPAGKSALLPAMGRRAWIFCAAACGPLGLLKMCGSE